ncbi:prolyl oligopeptidase family serine peptidase [Stenotrophomonas nematodicola]|uniref:Prolyl oligopeptidase family serine peptidase n=1 Tax=Stenotrophomonas nematodicola TaxID=2656746 RepID=A0ABW7CZ59_9GAMM
MARRHARWLSWTLVLVLAMLSVAGCAPSRSDVGHFEARAVKLDGRTRNYQVFIPRGARAASGALPVVLFLHGSGERGNDNRAQTEAGLGPYLRRHADAFPALVVLPQVPGDEEWSGDNNRAALAALDATLAEFGADPQRQYLTGMSMGGYGSWNIALASPQRFAAIVPVCGAVLAPRAVRPTLFVEEVAHESDPYAAIAARLTQTPIWIFHGARDDVVPPADDRRLQAAFQQAGAPDVRYTEYPDGNHNAWDATYADATMWTWLWAQRRH